MPLDHLRSDERVAPGPEGAPAEPAAPSSPGNADGDAVRGKGTRSPAAVATREHLEGSEQGPV